MDCTKPIQCLLIRYPFFHHEDGFGPLWEHELLPPSKVRILIKLSRHIDFTIYLDVIILKKSRRSVYLSI